MQGLSWLWLCGYITRGSVILNLPNRLKQILRGRIIANGSTLVFKIGILVVTHLDVINTHAPLHPPIPKNGAAIFLSIVAIGPSVDHTTRRF
jgi:hypothetical protein